MTRCGQREWRPLSILNARRFLGDSNKATRVVATLDQGGALRRCLNYRQWVFRCGVPGLAGGWWRADNHHEGLARQKIQDIYSAGCVLTELLLGQLIFPRDSGVEQLVEMIKEKEKTMETSKVSTTIRPCSEEGWTIP
ncbi:uncharacterized protein [Narcine bancroftii]|uniref:uncharacterized protein isoform X3 n=1 Tax=Narcine bancroftii TaxID=1343680 RepID=UPI0038312CC8